MEENKKLFVDAYTIYKSGAAMSMKPIEAKPNVKGTALEAGGFMLEMAKAYPDQAHRYDWSNGIRFYISAAEAMKFVRLLQNAEENQPIYHDPDKGREGEGTRAKTLSVGTYNDRKFIQIYLPGKKQSIKVFIDDHEEATLEVLIIGTLPKLFGW